jgi:hypothetical protein
MHKQKQPSCHPERSEGFASAFFILVLESCGSQRKKQILRFAQDDNSLEKKQKLRVAGMVNRKGTERVRAFSMY